MKHIKHLSLLLVVAFLAACSQQAPPSAGATEEKVSLHAVPGDIQTNSTELESWSFSDGTVVEVIGTGLGSANSSSCEVVEGTVAISEPDSVTKLLAQVVVKGKSTNPDTNLPDMVTVSAGTETKSWTLDSSDTDSLTQSYVNPQGEPDLTEGGQVYEGSFDAAGSVTATVEGATTDGFCQPRALVVYVFRNSDTAASAGQTPNYYLYWRQTAPTATETITQPDDFVGGDVEVTFAISELQNDDRNVVLSASAGGVSESQSFTTPNQGDELLIVTLTLQDVPAGTRTVTATVESPAGTGDSIYWNGLNITIVPEPPPPPPLGGEGCTPGYWKQPHHFDSWTGYEQDDLFSSVFGYSITIKTNAGKGGKPYTTSDPTLLEAAWADGGGESALARHAVAALLNASSPEVSYGYTVAEVIDLVQQALGGTLDVENVKDMLNKENERGCPLN